MRTQDNEVMIMYHPESSKARQTVAYAHTLASSVSEWDFEKRPLTLKQWRELLDMLNLEPKELFDKSNDYYQEHLRGHDFDDEGWLNVLQRNTKLIKGPIVMKGRQARLCNTPTDIFGVVRELTGESAV